MVNEFEIFLEVLDGFRFKAGTVLWADIDEVILETRRRIEAQTEEDQVIFDSCRET